MATGNPIKKRISTLKKAYDSLRPGKESLLKLIDEAEVPESVYNSNAIENSTLTLKETEKILLEMELERKVDLREVFEAKNLARVIGFIRNITIQHEVNTETILLLHKMLLMNINDDIAGRFRAKGEYVRVGTHVAPLPEQVVTLMQNAFTEHSSNFDMFFLDKIARFHLDFETIHPFNDGNGRIGRVLVNIQLRQLGFPPIIVQNKDKREYYRAFREFRNDKKQKIMERIFSLALLESLHKRLAHLEARKVIPLTEYAKNQKKSVRTLLNSAKRQTLPAFREKGVWVIGV